MKNSDAKIFHALRHMGAIMMFSMLIITGTFVNHVSAYYYQGGNWGGENLFLNDGDTLSGTFSNVGLFQINNGAVVASLSDQLGIFADSIYIDGTFKFGDLTNSQVLTLSSLASIALNSNSVINVNNGVINLTAGTSITSNGSMTAGSGVLTAGSGILTGNLTLTIGNRDVTLPPGTETIRISDGGITTVGGGDISLATPIPPAMPLFGSGLAALGLLRRRMKTAI
ncbi:MAG: hypothetical protein HXX17_05920 [Geobacteraceae bacterium]|nr:hypothetical protein [Geobacteraceae bacterium]